MGAREDSAPVRRDLGTDPYERMQRPDPAAARGVGIDRKVFFARWQSAYAAAGAARGFWKAAAGVS